MTVGTNNDRCGYSQRLPFVVISPYTRENYVSSNLTNTASVVKFIEDNWLHGERIPGSFDAISGSLYARGGVLDFRTRPHFTPVILNPTTGAVVSGGTGRQQVTTTLSSLLLTPSRAGDARQPRVPGT